MSAEALRVDALDVLATITDRRARCQHPDPLPDCLACAFEARVTAVLTALLALTGGPVEAAG